MKKVLWSMTLFFALLTGLVQASAPLGRAIPVHLSGKNQKWYVLLQKIGNDWNDFGQRQKLNQTLKEAAQEALANATNNQVTGNFANAVEKITSDQQNYFYYVPIGWVDVNNLPGGSAKFTMAEIDNLPTPISPAVFNNFFDNWSTVKGQLGSGPSVTGQKLVGDPITQITLNRVNQGFNCGGASGLSVVSVQQKNWSTIPGAIYFYETNWPFYEFTNFWKAPLSLAGGTTNDSWPTSEHYFQAMKADDANVQEIVKKKPTPRGAFDHFRDNPKDATRRNWHSVKYQFMMNALWAKFNNTYLTPALLATDNCVIVEAAGSKDAEWGAGPNNAEGNNYLGRMLMYIRAVFQGLINPSQIPFMAGNVQVWIPGAQQLQMQPQPQYVQPFTQFPPPPTYQVITPPTVSPTIEPQEWFGQGATKMELTRGLFDALKTYTDNPKDNNEKILEALNKGVNLSHQSNDPRLKNEDSMLVVAIKLGASLPAQIIEKLLKSGGSPLDKDKQGKTAIDWAKEVYEQNDIRRQFILQERLNQIIKDKTIYGYSDTKDLIEFGLDVNYSRKPYESPLLRAINGDNGDVVEALLDKGAGKGDSTLLLYLKKVAVEKSASENIKNLLETAIKKVEQPLITFED